MTLFDASLSGLDANAAWANATAHNLANIKTDGFKRTRVNFEAREPEGVNYALEQDQTPGPLVPKTDGSGEMVEASNVDIAQETTSLLEIKHAYTANLQAIKTKDEIMGTLLNLVG